MNLDGVERGKAENEEKEGCFLCLKESDLRCERCGIPYCCEDHLKSHGSKTRKDYCLPFRIRHRTEVSRVMAPLSIAQEQI